LKLKSLLIILLCLSILFVLISTTSATDNTTIIAKYGSRGKIVREIQTNLYTLEYLKKSQIDGCYGKITTEAVKSFQLEHLLEVTGIVDTETYNQLKEAIMDDYFDYVVLPEDNLYTIAFKYNLSVSALMVYNKLNEDSLLIPGDVLRIPTDRIYLNKGITNRGTIAKIQAVPWSIVNKLWKVGEVAIVTDYLTGKSFRVKRIGGRLHIDVRLMTKNDIEILYSLNNSFTWKRRGVIVTIHGQKIAGSINEMPHGLQNMICVHFAGSRIHLNNMVDEEHLNAIETVEEDKDEILINEEVY
jgi:LysM repeat protein